MERPEHRFDYAHNIVTKSLLYSAARSINLHCPDNWSTADGGIFVCDLVPCAKSGQRLSEPRIFNSLTSVADATELSLALKISVQWENSSRNRSSLCVSLLSADGVVYEAHQKWEGMTTEQIFCKAVTEAAAWHYRRPMKGYT